MKINWNENPLMTTVELDEHESKDLWYKIKLEEMEDLLFEAHCYMGFFNDECRIAFDQNLDRVEEALDPNYYMSKRGERTPLDERVDLLHKECVEVLLGPHCGDCVCVACSCVKCMAEEFLGIRTTEGLGSHEAMKIHSAFGEYQRPWKRTRNIDQVIEYLENYNAYDDPPDWEGWEPHAARWNKEAKNACEWLKSYKNQHFNNS